MVNNFWEVSEIAVSKGPKVEIRDFDMALYKKITELLDKYGITFEEETPIQTDDDLSDRVFQAGKELYLSTGTYCMDTKRVVHFEQEELDEALFYLRGEISVGCGTEQRLIRHRKPDEHSIPFIEGGVVGGNSTEELQVQLYQSVAQEPLVDAIYFDPPALISGFRVEHGTPLELMAARIACLNVRKAASLAGRPGIHLLAGAGSAVADMGCCDPESGLRPTDAICTHTTSELKTDLDSLNKVAYTLHYGCLRQVWWAPVIGGFAGGPAGAAVAAVAGFFHSLLIGMAKLPSAYMGLRVTPYFRAGATDPMCFWVLTTAGQAITRNSRAIIQGSMNTSAGPGTLMMFYEIAASAVTMVVSGMHIFGVRIHRPTRQNHGSGLESRFMAETARAAAQLNRKEAKQIVLQLIDRYKENHRNAPDGFSFPELYDLKSLRPKKEYLKIYHQAKRDLINMGLPLTPTE